MLVPPSSPSHAASLSLIGAGAYWLGAAGVGPIQAVVAAGCVVTISMLGLLVLRLVGVEIARREERFFIAAGPGLAVGLFILLFFRAIVSRAGFFGGFSVVTVIAFVAIFGGFRGVRRSPHMIQRSWRAFGEQLWWLPAMTGFLGLLLHREWWWNFPIVISCLSGSALLKSCKSRHSLSFGAAITVTAVVVSTWIAVSLRSDIWWMSSRNDDEPLFEAWSYSLAEWGPRTNPLVNSLSGIGAIAYHHLAYLLVGIVTIATGADSFVALLRIVPVLIGVSTCSSLFLFLQVVSKHVKEKSPPNTGVMALGCTLFFVSVNAAHPLSDALASSFLVGLLALAFFRARFDRFSSFFLFSVLMVGTLMFSKTAYVYAAVISLLVLALFRRGYRWYAIIPVLVGLAYSIFFSGVSLSNSVHFTLDAFNENMMGEHAYGGPIHKVIACIFLILPISMAISVRIELPQFFGESARFQSLFGAMSAVLIAGTALRMVLGVPTQGVAAYFVDPILIVATLVLITSLASSVTTPYQGGEILAILAMTIGVYIAWGVLLPEVFPDLNNGSAYAKTLRLLRNPEITGVLALGLSVIMRFFARISPSFRALRSLMSRRRLMVMVVLPGLVLSVGMSGLVARVEERRSETKSGEEDAVNRRVLGSRDLWAVGMKLRQVSTSGDLAAYSVCDFTIEDNRCSSSNIIGAYSRRRFLHLGGVSDYFGLSSAAEESDFLVSASMFEVPGSVAVARLSKRGVSFVIIDRARASQEWIMDAESEGVSVMYTNDSYLLLRL